MSIGDIITQPIPAVSTTGTAYASQLVAFLQEVKARLEAKLPLTSLLAGYFDLSNNAVANAQYVGLYPQADTASEPVGSFFNYQGNLYWQSSSGAAQITAGSAINAASVAGIGGDYGGANPALVYFSDTDQFYYFYDDYGATAWAGGGFRCVDVHAGYTSALRVRLAFGGAGNYTLTLPPAVPAANGTPLLMDTGGNVTAAATGITSLTLGTNNSITLSGTGHVKTGGFIRTYSTGVIGVTTGSMVATLGFYTGGPYTNSGPGSIFGVNTTGYIPLWFGENESVSQLQIYFMPIGAGSTTFSVVQSSALGELTVGTVTVTHSTPNAAAITSTISGLGTIPTNTFGTPTSFHLKVANGAGQIQVVGLAATVSVV